MIAALTHLLQNVLKEVALGRSETDILRKWWEKASQRQEVLQLFQDEQIIEAQEIRTVEAHRKGYLSSDAVELVFNTHVKPRLVAKLPRLVQMARQELGESGNVESLMRSHTAKDVQEAVSGYLKEQKKPQVDKKRKSSDSSDVLKAPVPLNEPKSTGSGIDLGQAPGEHSGGGTSRIDLAVQPNDADSNSSKSELLFFPRDKKGPKSSVRKPKPPQGPVFQTRPQDLIGIGSKVGKCNLVEEIGRGGNGRVFRAIHPMLNISLAIKVLRPEILEQGGEKLMTRFVSEAQVLARLNHPNILRFVDFDYNPVPHLVLEFIEGLSLAELIQQSGSMRSDRALDIILQACEGLNAARKMGIVHRDIKPGNILINREGVVKIADFGLAIDIDAKPDSYKEPIGTIAYISPEQIMNASKVDHRSDIYSLGATFYHAVTGRVPFPTKNQYEGMMMHLQQMPIAPCDVAPEVPKVISDVIMRMLAKNPSDRFQNYDGMSATLRSLMTCLGYSSTATSNSLSTKSYTPPHGLKKTTSEPQTVNEPTRSVSLTKKR